MTDCPATADIEVAVVGHDPLDAGLRAGWRDDDLVARRGPSRSRSSPRSRGSRGSGRLTHCTGSRNGRDCMLRWSISTVSRYSISVGPWYHGHRLASAEHVVALQRRDGDAGDALEADLARRRPGTPSSISRKRSSEYSTRSILLTASATSRMPSSDTSWLWRRVCVSTPLAGVDEDHGAVRGRGAGDHVARVLLVARRVGDDEVPALGREMAVGDVDRDPLLALGRQAVEEQREVELVALRARPPWSRPRAPPAGPTNSERDS